MVTSTIIPNDEALKLIYLVPQLGEYALVPDGAIVNIGGVKGPNFTVGGKPLLFADGTSTDGSSNNFLRPDFQGVYINSVGEAFIDFTSGKDFVLQAVNNKQFRFDADTGEVTITGDLTVLGETTTVINASVETDRVAIHQTAGTYIPFIMEPVGGVTPTVNVVDIKVARSGASVFTIGPTGVTYIQSLTTGLINGIDLTALAADLNEHLDAEGIKHSAEQISVDDSELDPITGSNVQEALQSIAQVINTLTSTSVGGDVRGYEHTQLVASSTWVISHNQSTKRVHLTIWDEEDEQLWPDTISIFDVNTVLVEFSTPIVGRAVLMLFGGNVVPLPSPPPPTPTPEPEPDPVPEMLLTQPVFVNDRGSEAELGEEGRLAMYDGGQQWQHVATLEEMLPNTGKWYFEFEIVNPMATDAMNVGITPSGLTLSPGVNSGDAGMLRYFDHGAKRRNGIYEAYGAPYTTGDKIGFVVDTNSRGTITAYKNGESQGVMYTNFISPNTGDPGVVVGSSGYGMAGRIRLPEHIVGPIPQSAQLLQQMALG